MGAIQTAFVMSSMISPVSGNLRRRGGPFLRPDQMTVASDALSLFRNTEISNAPRRGGPYSLINSSKFFCDSNSAISANLSVARLLYVWHDLQTSNDRYASVVLDFGTSFGALTSDFNCRRLCIFFSLQNN